MNQTAERLMDLAENHMRHAGYGGFSFRDLAAEIGIKSASVHHHFPTKATMAAVANPANEATQAGLRRTPSNKSSAKTGSAATSADRGRLSPIGA